MYKHGFGIRWPTMVDMPRYQTKPNSARTRNQRKNRDHTGHNTIKRCQNIQGCLRHEGICWHRDFKWNLRVKTFCEKVVEIIIAVKFVEILEAIVVKQKYIR